MGRERLCYVAMTGWLERQGDRDRVVARCLLAVRGVSSRVSRKLCHGNRIAASERTSEPAHWGRWEDLRSGTSLAALTLKAANPFLMPLLPHLRGVLRKCLELMK